MKITQSKLQDFLSCPEKYGSVLFHGSDHGRISFYTQKVIQHVNKSGEFVTLRMDFPVVSKEPEQLFVNLSTVPMFHKKSLIILTDAKDSLQPSMKAALEQINMAHCYVVIQAKELSGSSSLRTYYNNHDTFASIGCYKEDSVSHIVAEFLSNNQLSCNNTTLRLLCSVLQNSTACIQPELEKLLLYLGDKKHISADDVQKSFSADLDPILDDVCVAIADGNVADFLKLTASLFQNKVSPVLIIRAALKYFMTLEYLMRQVKAGLSIDEAIRSVSPPIFFKLIPKFKRHIGLVPYASVCSILLGLYDAEIRCKVSDAAQDVVFKYAMFAIIKRIHPQSL